MSFTVKTAAATIAIAFIAVAGAKAQETEFDGSAVGAFTQDVSIELNTEFAVATDEMEASYADLDEDSTIKPDMSYAQYEDEDNAEEDVFMVAAR